MPRTPTISLFDVDGTLVTTDGAGREAFDTAFAEAFGPDHGLLEFSFAGMTDPLLVRRALRASDEPITDATIESMIETYLDHLPGKLRDRAGYRVFPGVETCLDAVFGRDGLAVGLGTGNVERGARLKLRPGGLDERFDFGGFGSDATERADILRAGFERGAARLGRELDACRLVVIGDTPRDVSAARELDAEVCAVATGGVETEDLRDCDPDLLVDDLTDSAVVEFVVDA